MPPNKMKWLFKNMSGEKLSLWIVTIIAIAVIVCVVIAISIIYLSGNKEKVCYSFYTTFMLAFFVNFPVFLDRKRPEKRNILEFLR